MERMRDSVIWKQDGMMSVEASYIFPILMMLLLVLIRLDFTLHDRLLSDVCLIKEALRLEQAKDHAYDKADTGFRAKLVLDTPVLSKESNAYKKLKKEVRSRTNTYYVTYQLGDHTLSKTDPETVLGFRKIPDILRTGTRIMQIIGEIKKT